MNSNGAFTREECADILVEILRISVHQILWARKLYPREIFRLHKQFSISVQKSLHPEVNKYIDSILSTVRLLLLEEIIERFVVVIRRDKPIENFVFSLNSFYSKPQSGKMTFNLNDIKEQARSIWLGINHRFGSDNSFKEDCTYTFEIHTRRCTYEKMLTTQTTDNCQWEAAEETKIPNDVIPVRKLGSPPFTIDVYVENFCDEHS